MGANCYWPYYLFQPWWKSVCDMYTCHALSSTSPTSWDHSVKLSEEGATTCTSTSSNTYKNTWCHRSTHASGCCRAVFIALICWKWQDMSVAITISITKVRNSLSGTPRGERSMEVKKWKVKIRLYSLPLLSKIG